MVQSLGQEDPLEEEMYPLQYSCLENSMDRGARWATVHGVTESDTTEPLTFTPLAFLNNVYAVICHQCYSWCLNFPLYLVNTGFALLPNRTYCFASPVPSVWLYSSTGLSVGSAFAIWPMERALAVQGFKFYEVNIRLFRKTVLEYSWVGFPGGSDGKASACKAGDPGSIPGVGISLGEGHGNPLQHSCLENPMDRGALVVCSPWGHKSRHNLVTL